MNYFENKIKKCLRNEVSVTKKKIRHNSAILT